MQIHAEPATSLHRYLDRVTINTQSPVPAWRQVAAFIRERIESGALTGRLPSEKDFVHEYGVAQGTVRKALALLRDEGLIETTPGLGSFVTAPRQPAD
jgi:GntR family transcriptional regulator